MEVDVVDYVMELKAWKKFAKLQIASMSKEKLLAAFDLVSFILEGRKKLHADTPRSLMQINQLVSVSGGNTSNAFSGTKVSTICSSSVRTSSTTRVVTLKYDSKIPGISQGIFLESMHKLGSH
jgi:hypothetical protein